MAFFKGQEIHSIDNKGRVNIPVKMRKSLSPESNDTFAITRGLDKCITAYPIDEWKKYEGKFAELNQYDEKNRYFLRMLLMWSEESSLDAQQRIILPRKLMDFASIDGKVMIVGMGDHIEFWNPDEFAAYLNKYEDSYEKVAEQVFS